MAAGPVKLKCCTKCKQWKKALPEYYSGCQSTRDKLQSWCKTCVAALVKEKYQTNPTYHKAINDDQRGRLQRLRNIKQAVDRMLVVTCLNSVESLEQWVTSVIEK